MGNVSSCLRTPHDDHSATHPVEWCFRHVTVNAPLSALFVVVAVLYLRLTTQTPNERNRKRDNGRIDYPQRGARDRAWKAHWVGRDMKGVEEIAISCAMFNAVCSLARIDHSNDGLSFEPIEVSEVLRWTVHGTNMLAWVMCAVVMLLSVLDATTITARVNAGFGLSGAGWLVIATNLSVAAVVVATFVLLLSSLKEGMSPSMKKKTMMKHPLIGHQRQSEDVSRGEVVQHAPSQDGANTSWIGYITFSWASPLIKLGNIRPLEKDDLASLSREEKSEEIQERFVDRLEENGGNIVLALWSCTKRQFIAIGMLRVGELALSTANPLLLKALIDSVQYSDNRYQCQSEGDDCDGAYDGLLFLLPQLLCWILLVVVQNQYGFTASRLGIRIGAVLNSAVFHKSLKLSVSSRQGSTVGEILNYMSVDAGRVAHATHLFHAVWFLALQAVSSLVLLSYLLKSAVLAAIGVLLIFGPINIYIIKTWSQTQKEFMKNSDSRISAINEIVQSMKIVKMFAWEKMFQKKIFDIRAKELKGIRTFASIISLVNWTTRMLPVLMCLATFSSYSLVGYDLEPGRVFAALMIFNELGGTLLHLPGALNGLVESKVAMRRLSDFFAQKEIERSHINAHPAKDGVFATITGDYSWECTDSACETPSDSDCDAKEMVEFPIKAQKPFGVRDMNLSMRGDELHVIVGPVGSGKTTLLLSLLGECPRIGGEISYGGSIAYCTQQPWILNGTVEHNITLGRPMDRSLYRKVLKACALETDLQVLAGGDQCEIGEKGVNLSGGQRARIALARACYSDADIFLLDDVLSAVDAETAVHLFKNCIGPTGLLSGKLRVLVTHNLRVCLHATAVHTMKDGRITESKALQEFDNKTELRLAVEEGVVDEESGPKSQPTEIAKGQLSEEEGNHYGEVDTAMFRVYIRAAGGYTLATLFVVSLVAMHGSRIGSDKWLSHWSDATTSVEASEEPTSYYLGIYGYFIAAHGLCIVVTSSINRIANSNAAKTMHQNLLNGVMAAPMKFFDTNPIGRIVNRFTKDIHCVDRDLTWRISDGVSSLLWMVGTVMLIGIVSSLCAVAFCPIAFGYYKVQNYYRRSSREIGRLESKSKSPVYSNFSECLGGLSTIRAHNDEKHFSQKNTNLVSQSYAASFAEISTNFWFEFRLEMLGTGVMFMTAFFGILGHLNPGLLGLTVTYAAGFTSSLRRFVGAIVDIEMKMNSVERITEYSEMEREGVLSHDEVPTDWPATGKIEFKDVSMKYRPELENVFNHLSFTIEDKEKVGVCGRTGSGKSSLAVSLFRLVELCNGRICLDGRDIARIPLDILRRRIGIITQEPVLFVGSVRSNIDPFQEYPEEELWHALRRVRLFTTVKEHVDGLDASVSENGENWSLGERQMLCLARALLKKPRVLFMDEATASVDPETDRFIQETIRSEFVSSTVITIAHRLETIVDSTRILVLNSGQLDESGPPSCLLSNPFGSFSALWAAHEEGGS